MKGKQIKQQNTIYSKEEKDTTNEKIEVIKYEEIDKNHCKRVREGDKTSSTSLLVIEALPCD